MEDNMIAGHTPGPWKVETKSVVNRIFGYPEACIAEINFKSNRPGEKKANAHLIAAAPELLEALQRIAAGNEMSGDYSHADTVAAYTRIATQAIAKAEGR